MWVVTRIQKAGKLIFPHSSWQAIRFLLLIGQIFRGKFESKQRQTNGRLDVGRQRGLFGWKGAWHAIRSCAAFCLWCDATHAPARGHLLGGYRSSTWKSKFISCQRREWKAQFTHDPGAAVNKWCPGCGKEVENVLLYLHVYANFEEGPGSYANRGCDISCSLRCHVMSGMLLSLWLLSFGPVKLAAGHCEATVAPPSTASYHEGCTLHVSCGSFGNPSRTIYVWGLVNHTWAAAVYNNLLAFHVQQMFLPVRPCN